MLPLLSYHGAPAERLLEDRKASITALIAARDSLIMMAPDRRDSWEPGSGGYDTALAEHHQRMASLDRMIAEIERETWTLAGFGG